jgi:hypothetical protein
MRPWRLPEEIAEALSPLPSERWRVEDGGKHYKLKIDNRLIGIMSKTNRRSTADLGDRTMRNTLAQIRRAIKGANNGRPS